MRQFAKNRHYSAGWSSLINEQESTRASLDDPFSDCLKWNEIPAPAPGRRRLAGLRSELVARLVSTAGETEQDFQPELFEMDLVDEPASTEPRAS